MEVTGRKKRRSFKDNVEHSSAESDEVFCQPCSNDDHWVVAVGYCQNCSEYFCAACLKTHRNQSMSKHHVILKDEDMPRSQMTQILLDPCSDPCDQHPNEIVKFYCSLHDNVGCGDCMVLSHKTCKVDRIQDISSTYFSSAEHQDLVRYLDKFLKDLDKLRDHVQTNEHSFKENCSRVVNAIQSFRKEVNDYLDKREAEILTEVAKRKEMDQGVISKLETERRLLQDEMKEIENRLNQQSDKANELFVAAKNFKKRMSFLDTTLNQMFQTSQIKEYKFELSPKVQEVLVSQVPLGKLKENGEHTHLQRHITSMTPRFEGEVDVRTPEDKPCRLVASAVISPTKVVLADYDNQCIKLVDIGLRKVMAKHGFKSIPTDVARVDETTVAVALPREQMIQFLTISKDDTFSKIKKLKVNGSCVCLCFEQEKIVIAYEGKIDIMNISGSLVKSITFPDLKGPTGIVSVLDSKSFLVSNREFKGKPTAVYKLNYNGSLEAMYTEENLSRIGGLTVTGDGTVLVCNLPTSGSILAMSLECKAIAEFIEDNEHARRPRCVSFCNETKRLFMCNHLDPGSEDKLNDTLKIFQLY